MTAGVGIAAAPLILGIFVSVETCNKKEEGRAEEEGWDLREGCIRRIEAVGTRDLRERIGVEEARSLGLLRCTGVEEARTLGLWERIAVGRDSHLADGEGEGEEDMARSRSTLAHSSSCKAFGEYAK